MVNGITKPSIIIIINGITLPLKFIFISNLVSFVSHLTWDVDLPARLSAVFVLVAMH